MRRVLTALDAGISAPPSELAIQALSSAKTTTVPSEIPLAKPTKFVPVTVEGLVQKSGYLHWP